MIIEVDNCVDCTSMGLPCIGSICRNRKHKIRCCDKCEREETLYRYNDGEYCIDCIKEMLEIVEEDD